MIDKKLYMTLSCFDKEGRLLPNISGTTNACKEVLIIPDDITPGNNYFPNGTVRAELTAGNIILTDIIGNSTIDMIIGNHDYLMDVDSDYVRHYDTFYDASFAIASISEELKSLCESKFRFVDSISYDSFNK